MENLLIATDNSAVIAQLQKENDELKELSGQLFSVITHAVSMLSGKAKQNDFVINMKGHHFFECSLLIAQISQLVDCETPQQSLADLSKERDELKAHCEVANTIIKVLAKTDAEKVIAEVWFEKPPQQSLAEIKAEAIEDAFYEYACEKHGAFGADGSEEEEWGIDKANQLREQGDRE
jgi:hypothetical protein